MGLDHRLTWGPYMAQTRKRGIELKDNFNFWGKAKTVGPKDIQFCQPAMSPAWHSRKRPTLTSQSPFPWCSSLQSRTKVLSESDLSALWVCGSAQSYQTFNLIDLPVKCATAAADAEEDDPDSHVPLYHSMSPSSIFTSSQQSVAEPFSSELSDIHVLKYIT